MEGCSPDDVADAFAALNVAAARAHSLLAELSDEAVAAADGSVSRVAWLRSRVGMSAGEATRAVRLARKLAEAPEPEWQQVRHVYLFEPLSPLPERWTHVVSGKGEDSGMAFDYYWLPVTPALKLAGAQERFLHLAVA